jgi:hypothetical protein
MIAWLFRYQGWLPVAAVEEFKGICLGGTDAR